MSLNFRPRPRSMGAAFVALTGGKALVIDASEAHETPPAVHHGRAYRGGDRRGLVAGQPPDRILLSLLVGGTSFAGVLTVVSAVSSSPAPARLDMLQAPYDVVTLAFAMLLAILCHLHWRCVGSPFTARLTYAVAAWLVVRVLDTAFAIVALDTAPLRWMRFVSLLGALGLAGTALVAPDIDTRLRPRRAATSAAVGLLTCSLLFVTVAGGLGVSAPAPGGDADAVVAVAWLALGSLYYRRCVRQQRPLHGWFAILFLFLGYAQLLPFGSQRSGLVVVGARLLELGGLIAALGGAVSALAQAWRVLGGRLMEAEHSRRTVEARVEVERARDAERAHEARNALTAIEGATRALQAHTDRMEPRERDALSEAVSAEIARLQRLVAGRPAEPEHGRFRLVEAIAAVVTCERWLGAAIEVDVPEDLVVVGSPTSTAEVVQNLLQNARRHGLGPAQIWAHRDDAEVVLRVRDHGPGIPADEADIVFERGGRGRAARRRPGSGLGLHVARDLMLAQGGRLWLEDREEDGHEGACFALALPGLAAAGTLYAVPRPLAVQAPLLAKSV